MIVGGRSSRASSSTARQNEVDSATQRRDIRTFEQYVLSAQMRCHMIAQDQAHRFVILYCGTQEFATGT